MDVIPFRFSQSQDTVYVIGRKILGQELSGLLAARPDLTQLYDTTVAGIIDTIMDHRNDEDDYMLPDEVFDPDQYMFGTPSDQTDADPQIWFVDIDPSGSGTIRNIARMDAAHIALSLESAARCVIVAAQDAAVDNSLPASSASLLRAIETLRETKDLRENTIRRLDDIEEALALGDLEPIDG